ncbi:MAG: hypothetical protein ACLP9L_29815 [Thermoguttaceae bacterium]
MPYNGMPSELLFLRQFLSQLGPNYPQLAMLVGLLLVVIYRPERIYRTGMFRLSCVLLAVSILVTPITMAISNTMIGILGNGLGRPGNPSEFAALLSLVQVLEPILVALSICFGIFSLLPPSREQSRSGPAQHPLEP